ncbi:Predicted nucleotidyltransferases [Shewanella baltica]|uniref:type VII toxin-antitoxin system MntA family adenylyltransferase antitoxin n=1 Tax=Shewanella baltica TaxID=62322 RepID=UPI000F6BDECE|nr:nucleotidyltransferase domain-containing protein [Shewanella baltica]VEF25386.1 Predicted nucleotidyltransferases [Shewanella baltica]VEF25411.1 Predicted nucleotidyltransferases [Shewanella baltica]
MQQLNESIIINLLQDNIPQLRLIYLFGSYAQGTQHRNSDIDIAVLADVTVDNIARWQLAQKLASALDTDVDLVDLRTASTVLCQQVVTQGKRLWGTRQDDEIFAVKTISMYQHLQAERQAIIDDATAKTIANDHRGRHFE